MSINLDRVSDAQTVANKLTGLPKEALLYIAGYAEGCRDKPTRKRRPTEKKRPTSDGAGIKEVKRMNNQQIKETLEKQLQLLSERSEKSAEDRDLYQLTNAMVSLSALLLSFG